MHIGEYGHWRNLKIQNVPIYFKGRNFSEFVVFSRKFDPAKCNGRGCSRKFILSKVSTRGNLFFFLFFIVFVGRKYLYVIMYNVFNLFQ